MLDSQFRSAFESASVGMVLTDRDGTVLDSNPAWRKFIGYSQEELTVVGLCALTLPSEIQADVESRARVVRGEVPNFSRDKAYLHKDGSIVWGALSISAIEHDASGQATRLMAVVQDISARKKLESELATAQELLELAIRGSEVGIWAYELLDGKLATARQTLKNVWEMLGYDPVVDVLPEVAEVLHPDDYARVEADVLDYLAGETSIFETEHRARHKDGSWRSVLGRGVAIRNEAGGVVRFVGASVDITEIKRIGSDLLRAREAAESANRAKDEFLANVSHEMRTPMNAILGMTELCLDAAESDKQRKLLSTVRSAAKNLLSIINDLLDFSKIAAGKLALDEADFSLRSALADAIDALEPRAQRNGVMLRLGLAEDLPDMLFGDVGKLRQVMTNLVGNAIKFTPQGEVDVEVSGAFDGTDVELSVEVRDTGIGIPPQKQAAIFQAFEQEDSSTTRKYGGTGLGLTIAAQLVALMGGQITVDSQPGHGSTFRFSARFGQARTNNVLVADELVAAPPSERPTRSELRILVAEDNELNVTLMRELLIRAGHQTTFAANGQGALELAKSGRFDLLLLDLHLPELDGFEIARAIREHERALGGRLPIVAVTARSSKLDHARCIAVGMDGFLTKPLDADELLDAIASVSAEASDSVVDAQRLLQACAHDAEALEEMCRVMRATLPAHLERVAETLGRADIANLREAVQQLRGAMNAFSSKAVSLAESIEDEATGGDLGACIAGIAKLQALCSHLLQQSHSLTLEKLSAAHRDRAPVRRSVP